MSRLTLSHRLDVPNVLPPMHWRRLEVAYVKSVKIGVRGFDIIMRAGMKGLKVLQNKERGL